MKSHRSKHVRRKRSKKQKKSKKRSSRKNRHSFGKLSKEDREYLNILKEDLKTTTNKKLIDYHKDNKKVKLTKYDGKNLPYDNDVFDRIIISHCLEHILSPENFLSEMIHRVL